MDLSVWLQSPKSHKDAAAGAVRAGQVTKRLRTALGPAYRQISVNVFATRDSRLLSDRIAYMAFDASRTLKLLAYKAAALNAASRTSG
jgi:hypothetical protein